MVEIKEARGKVYEDSIGFPTQYGPIRTDTKPGAHLIPHELLRDTVLILGYVAMMWFLSALGPPTLGHPANPTLQPFTMPDWYLLWTFGLVKVSTIFPTIMTPPLPGLGSFELGPGFWAAQLTIVPIILLILLPFLDRGFEARPVKAPLRSAIGVAGLLWVFGASLVSIDTNVDKWYGSYSGGQSLGQLWLWLWFILPPVFGGVATYVALRRLAFKPMHRTNAIVSCLTLLGFVTYVLLTYAAWPLTHPTGGGYLFSLGMGSLAYLAAFLVLLGLVLLLVFFAVTFLEEHRAKQMLLVTLSLIIMGIFGLAYYALSADRAVGGPALQNLAVHSQFVIGLPLLGLFTAYFGLRTPYSDYEYKLNECYQCGRCHLVCPITKADADALGGLNLVYNVYKKQHDGVPMWACLTCDACSAVCPLDINYSVYVLAERAKHLRGSQGGWASGGHGRPAPASAAADGGTKEVRKDG